MKLHTYIVGVLLLLFSGSSYTDDSQGVVPWSISSALSSASSTVGSWSSSAVSTISALPTETKIAIGGGLAVLTGDYFLYRCLDKKYKEQDLQDFRDLIKDSGLKKGSQYKGYVGGSLEQRKSLQEYQDRNKLLNTTLEEMEEEEQTRQARLDEILEVSLGELEEESLGNHQRLRSNSDVSSAPSTVSVTSLVSSDSRESSSVASSRGISSEEEVSSDQTVHRRLRSSSVPTIPIPSNTERTRSQSISDLDTDRELAYGLDERGTFIRDAQEISLDAQRYINLLKAQAASKKREEEQRRQQERDKEEAEDYGFVPLDKGDCANLHHQYVNRGKQIMGKFKKGEHVPATLETLLSVTAHHYNTVSNDDTRVVIESPEISKNVMLFWNEENKKQSASDLSTYMSSNGTLVVALPEGELRQGCILPDGVSHLELSPGNDGVTVTLHRTAPPMEATWENYRNHALESVRNIVSDVSQLTGSGVNATRERIGHGLSQRAERYGYYLREAAASGNKAMIAWSLANGADINAPVRNNDGVGLRPLHCAVMNGQHEAVRLLLQMKAKPCLASWHNKRAGLLPIHIAAAKGDLKMVELLLEYQSPCDKKFRRLDSGQEVSALDLAKQYGHVSIARVLAKKLYPAMYDEMYGNHPKLIYLERTWNMFGTDTPEVIEWKLTVLTCAYEELQKELQGKKKLKARKIADIDHAELQDIKDWLDAQLTLLTQKSSELQVVISKGQSSPEHFISGMDAECAANKLSLEPKAYYVQLGYATWQEGVSSSFSEVKSRFEEHANKDGLSDDKARMYRQIGFFLRDSKQKGYFDHYLKLCNQSQEEQDGFGVIGVNDDGVPEAQDAQGCFIVAGLGEEAMSLAQKYGEMSSGDALMYLKEMQTVMQRTLNKSVPHDVGRHKKEEQ